MRFAGVIGALALATSARADILKRVLDVGDGGGSAPPLQPGSDAAVDLAKWAGESRAMTLAEILQISVRQAPSLVNARIDTKVADAQIEETWVRNDWKVQSQLSYSHSGGVISGIALNDQTTFTATGDLIRGLPTGGTFDLHASAQYTDFDLGPPFGASKEWYDTVTGSITQPLLKGAGRKLFDANERKARLSKDATILAKRLAAIQTVQAVISAYWDLVLAEKQVAITEASLDLARERLRVTTVGADGGKIARSEIPAVEQIIATRQEDVLNGELAVLNFSIALRRAAGMPIGANELGLRVDTSLDTRDTKYDLGALVEAAYTASPQLAQLAKQKDSSTIDIEVTENGLLPQLDAALTLGPSGQDRLFASSLKSLAELDQLAISGTLTFSRGLSQHDVKGRSRELRLARDKIAVNAFDLKAQIAQTMAQAVAQLELANRRMALSRRAIALANQNIQIETDRFNLGKSTNFDVLNRLEDLRQAELRQAQAKIDWHKAEIVVLALTGDILPAFGITVD